MTLLPLVPPDEMPAPRGVYPIPLELEDGEQEALLWTDDADAPADVLKVNLVDDEIVIGSSGRPMSIKVYDSGLGAEAALALAAHDGNPVGFTATVPAGTCHGCWQFDGDLTDLSGNGYTLTLAGPSGGVARYPRWLGKRGLLLDGKTYAYRLMSGAANLLNTGALTIEMLCAQLPIHTESTAQQHLVEWGALWAARDAASSAPGSRSQYQLLCGASSATTWNFNYYHQTAAPALEAHSDADVMVPGHLQVVTLTRDSAGTAIKLYLNGYEVASWTAAAAPGGTAPDTFYVGAVPKTGGLYAFRGWIGGLRFTNAEFSAAQVKSEAWGALGRKEP